ncbi:MAG TPA: hypothetical protein VFJ43_06010, partial [Bacteroidia bacterium]|nr:hypothetical protein [Bacteroidia bacterium]
MKIRNSIFLFLLVLLCSEATAQDSNWKFHKGGNWYFSWGYSKWWYPKTDIHFNINSTDANDKALHSEYTLKDCTAHDSPFISKIFVIPLTVPQFCVRIGYFFNADQSLGAELTYDHAKFVVNTDQYVRMVGNTNGVAFDSLAHLYPDASTGAQPFIFKLNNGANFFEFNLVKKFTLFQCKSGKFKLFYLLKSGLGWNTPHVENTIFGEKNKPHFQAIGGWNVGAEGAIRMLFFNRTYLEFGQKVVYASYYGLRLAQGTARVHLATYGTIL